MNSDASSFKRKQTAHITTKVNVSQVLPVIGNKFGDTCKQYTLVNLAPISLYTAHGNSTQLNSTENYGRRCLTPLSLHRNYILS